MLLKSLPAFLFFLGLLACSVPLPSLTFCKTDDDCQGRSCIQAMCQGTQDSSAHESPRMDSNPPDSAPEKRPESRPEPTPEPRPEPLQEKRPESRPEPQAEVKPELQPEGLCSSDADCKNGFACKQNRCLTSCRQDQDCHQGLFCSSGPPSRCYVQAIQPSSSKPFQWSNGTFAADCMQYRLGREATNSTVRYAGSTSSGIYAIQPAGVTTPFLVSCDMTTEGGGWTLVLKADGSKPNFAYDKTFWTNPSPLWTATSPSPSADPDASNRTEALLRSYDSVPLNQILVSFDTNGVKKEQIFDLQASSLHQRLSDPAFQTFQRPSEPASWHRLLPGDVPLPLHPCKLNGLSVVSKHTLDKDSFALRMGFFSSKNEDCQGPEISFIGVGSRYPPSTQLPSPPSVGSYHSAEVSKTFPSFARIYVREIPSSFVLIENNRARFADGIPLPDCLHLAFREEIARHPRRPFLLLPPGATDPFYALCQNDLFGGGWTLILKADGSRPTFTYDAPLWTATDPKARTYQTDKADFDGQETLLPTYDLLPIRQTLVQMAPLPVDFSTHPTPFRSLVAPVSISSLGWAIGRSFTTLFVPEPSSSGWKALLENSYLSGGCNPQGISLSVGNESDLLAKLRFGILGDSDCSDPNSYIGFGPKLNSSNTDKAKVGNVYEGSNPDVEIKAIGFLSARDVAASTSSTSDAEIVERNSARERKNGTLESSCRAYAYKPLAGRNPLPSDRYRLLPVGASSSAQAYEAYCDMNTDGGGWTLVMKIDGNKPTFGYASEWETIAPSPSNPNPDFNFVEAKLQSYAAVPFSEILIKMLPRPSTQSAQAKTLRLVARGRSLYDLLRAGTFLPFERGAGRAAWRSLLPTAPLQERFLLEGFNLPLYDKASKVRIGIVANNEPHADSNDSVIGIGLTGDIAAGHRHEESPKTKTAAFVWIFVR